MRELCSSLGIGYVVNPATIPATTPAARATLRALALSRVFIYCLGSIERIALHG